MHRHPVNDRIRPGKVDVFHRANRQLGLGRKVIFMQAIPVDDQQFPGLDIPEQFGPDNIQGTRFTGHHVGPVRQLP